MALTALLVACTHGTRSSPGEPCEIDGEAGVAPPQAVLAVRTGMSMHDVVRLVGIPGHSPVDGQYYFDGRPIEGDCVIDTSGGQKIPCTLVVSFRDRIDDTLEHRLFDRVQGCWWGGIGE